MLINFILNLLTKMNFPKTVTNQFCLELFTLIICYNNSLRVHKGILYTAVIYSIF